MKTTRTRILSLVAGFALAAATPTFAIEGLQLTIRCPDVVLSWPSIEGENYIVQWRETLSTNTPWVTLTNYLPAEWGTNITTFTHSNRVECPSERVLGRTATEKKAIFQLDYPLVVPGDGSRTPVPLGLYPPGLDLSGYVILWPDGSTDEWNAKLAEGWREMRQAQRNGLEPQGIEDGSEPDTGFYQVVRDGVHIVSITNLTNGVLSGTLPVLIEAGNTDYYGTDVRGKLSSASIIIDGEKFAGDGTLGAPSAYPWQFTFDTGYLENGDHTFQVQVTWKDPNNIDKNRKTLSRWSVPITISVSNEVYYPEWEPEVGEAGIAAFYLKTVYPDAAFQIIITDANSNLVQTLNGYATNGIIEAYWNLTDTNGVVRTNALADSSFNSQTVVQKQGGGSATKKNPPKKQRPKDWPDHGRWVIAYQDYFKYDYSQNNAKKGSINAFANTAQKYGGYYLYYPQPGQTNDIGQTYPMRYMDYNHPDTNVTYAAILLDLEMLTRFLGSTNSRNFYYDGHGDANELGDSSTESLKAYIKHRYRFVFLNACNSANGRLDTAFGITGPKRYDIDYYHKSGLRPAAFVGYAEEVNYSDGQPVMVNGVQYDSTIPWQVPGFITNFLFYWDPDLVGYGLLSSIDTAKSGLPSIAGQYRENFLRVFGYFNLHMDEFNHGSDTW